MPDYIPIHHVMHVEYGYKALLLLLLLRSVPLRTRHFLVSSHRVYINYFLSLKTDGEVYSSVNVINCLIKALT